MKCVIYYFLGVIISIGVCVIKFSKEIDKMSSERKALLCYNGGANGFFYPLSTTHCTFIKRPKDFEEIE